MNLKDLIAKMTAIEEGMAPPVAPTVTDAPTPQPGGAGAGDEGVEECGMPVAIGGPAQQDNHVTMNISMNGTGSDGVRSLMNILKDIEQAETEPHMGHQHEPEEPLMGDMVRAMAHEEDMGEEYENSVHGHDGATEFGIDAVTFTGDDLASKGKGALKHNGGENPMHESLVNRLTQMYQAIKEERTEEKDEKGNVVRWKEEGEWTKKSGKEGRGKVTNLSDKARRETEKMSNKEKEVAEGGWTLPPADASPEEQDAIMQKNKASQDYINKMASQQANGKDLGDGFTLTSIEALGKTRPAVLDTQSNTYYIPNRQEDGAAIIRSPAPYITIKDGKMGSSMGGPMTNAAMKKAGLSTQSQPPQQEDIELAEMLKIAGLR